MMLKGAANTARLKMQQTHPTKETLLGPLKASKETAITNPKPPTLNRKIKPMVNSWENKDQLKYIRIHEITVGKKFTTEKR